ncbi:MAG: MBL fold metallo-hydrolase [Phycisphaeraceae bacterium]|nr:MAG: MBL fold metallo-hydrolase [Phycisphaeraceae bacterium]
MPTIHHLNAGTLVVPGYPTVVCHCLAVHDAGRTVLIDSGIGLLDGLDPDGRLGRGLVEAAGFRFNARDTAYQRLVSLGIDPESVSDIVLTHADPDHAGGLADFPTARVHVSAEEHARVTAGHPRYAPRLFNHGPSWRTYAGAGVDWFGLPAARVDVPIPTAVLLVELPGHTAGHRGVAVESGGRWVLHAGDAYYLRAELTDAHHPVSAFAASRADDDDARVTSLGHLRRLAADHADAVSMFGYHDITELPRGCIDWE